MRRGTLVTIVVLFLLITVAAIAQIVIASSDHAPYVGPVSPGQLPPSPTP